MFYITKVSRPPGLVVSIFLLTLFWAIPSTAAIYMKFPDLMGDVTVNGEPGYLEVFSWSWGETNDVAGEGGGIFNDLTIVLPTSRATPRLLESFAAGTVIEEVTLTNVVDSFARGAAGSKYFLIRMKPVYITSYQTGGSSGDVVPVEELSLNFDQIKFEYREVAADGSVRVQVSRECSHAASQSQ